MQLYGFPYGAAAVAFAVILMSASAEAGWQTLLREDFADDPVASDRAYLWGDNAADRFSYDGSAKAVTASQDPNQPTARMQWDIGRTLEQDDTFSFSADFRMDALEPASGAVAFGLINSTTTGWDRGGGTYDESVAAFDLMTMTYFPDITVWGGPNLGTSIIESDEGQGYLGQYDEDGNLTSNGAINFPFGAEGDMDGQTLHLETWLTAEVTYDGRDRTSTLRILLDGEPLDINLTGEGGVGGYDGDTTTIQTILPDEHGFALDTFTLPLWEDTWESEDVTTGDLTFREFSLQVVPEPHAGALLAMATLMIGMRRNRRVR